MYTLSHDFRGNQRRGMVIPVEQIAMACHLGPRFFNIDSKIQLHSQVDTLSLSRHFYLNPFYNSFSFMHLRHWDNLARSEDAG
jgi:hypothetical protein